MVDVKNFSDNINKYFQVKEVINKTTQLDKWEKIYVELRDISNLINNLNIDLVKLTSKVEGLYLKDLINIDVELIGMKFHDITGQMKIISNHSEIPKRKTDKINSKFEAISEKCYEVSEKIISFISKLNELLKFKETLKNEVKYFEGNNIIIDFYNIKEVLTDLINEYIKIEKSRSGSSSYVEGQISIITSLFKIKWDHQKTGQCYYDFILDLIDVFNLNIQEKLDRS